MIKKRYAFCVLHCIVTCAGLTKKFFFLSHYQCTGYRQNVFVLTTPSNCFYKHSALKRSSNNNKHKSNKINSSHGFYKHITNSKIRNGNRYKCSTNKPSLREQNYFNSTKVTIFRIFTDTIVFPVGKNSTIGIYDITYNNNNPEIFCSVKFANLH